MENKVCLVTGGAGFIGSNLAIELLKRKAKVRIIDDLSTGREENMASIKDDVEFIHASITNANALRKSLQDVDYVFHQAAIPSVPRSVDDPLTTQNAGEYATLRLLWAAKEAGVKRVVYASSSSVYGDSPKLPKVEDMKRRPKSPYAISKLASEYYCQVFTQLYGLETVSLRYFNVFGPRQDPKSQYAAVIPKFIRLMLAGKQPEIYGNGLQSRDFTYIDNNVEANILAATAPKAAGEIMNIATNGRVNLLELVEKINTILGTNIEPTHSDPKPGDVEHSQADIKKAKELIGYQPIVSFEEGLKRTIKWLS